MQGRLHSIPALGMIIGHEKCTWKWRCNCVLRRPDEILV